MKPKTYKFNKEKVYFHVKYEELLPHIQKMWKKRTPFLIWASFDLVTKEYLFKEVGMSNFLDTMFGPNGLKTSKIRMFFRVAKNKIKTFLEDKCKIAFRASKKTIHTEFVRHLAIKAITKTDTNIYKESKAKAEVYYALINSKGLFGPYYLCDNIAFIDDLTTLLKYVNEHDEVQRITDIWMESNFKEADRVKSRKAHEKKIVSMIKIKKYRGKV